MTPDEIALAGLGFAVVWLIGWLIAEARRGRR